MSFRNRWRVEGTLTTLEPVHIGDGRILEPAAARKRELPEFVEGAGLERPVQVSTVATFPRNGARHPGEMPDGLDVLEASRIKGAGDNKFQFLARNLMQEAARQPRR